MSSSLFPIIPRGSPKSAHQNHKENVPLIAISKPPIANHETAEDLDDSNHSNPLSSQPSEPYPGVDDGFFTPKETPNTEVEIINPHDYEGGEIPELSPRAGGDGGSDNGEKDENDGRKLVPNNIGGFQPNFPSSGFGPDLEGGSIIPDLETIPDFNVYQHKKTLAQGMMDLALFSANANQLRYVLESSSRHPYFYPSLVLLSVSLLCQVAVGCGLIWNATYNVRDDKHLCVANKINNFTVIGIFLVTVVNVFISAFGVANPAAVAAVVVATST